MPKLVYVSYLAPIVASFLKKYPDVSIELCFDDRQVDVVSRGYDAGIRLSDILAKDLTAYKLAGPIEFVAAASPSYLKKNGRPKSDLGFLILDLRGLANELMRVAWRRRNLPDAAPGAVIHALQRMPILPCGCCCRWP